MGGEDVPPVIGHWPSPIMPPSSLTMQPPRSIGFPRGLVVDAADLPSLLPMTLYTVEQLELIRRLKLTGISIEAVVEAFHEIGTVTNELSSVDSMRQALLATQLLSPVVSSSSLLPPLPIPSSSVLLALQQAQSSSVPLQPLPLSASASPSSETPRIRSTRTPMREITTLDDPNELEEFMAAGEEACIGDMKDFITHFSLRQTTVAMMTGVSQPYISKLLNGNHRELSLRCRKNIYSWYLNCRRHPEKLSSFLNDPSSRLETNGEGELVPQKRERYVFRPVLLRILEQFFSETPFPDVTRRIEIATACNHALQQEKRGVGLMPKEVVSPQVVANWFANKRKEIRRKNQGGDPTPSPLQNNLAILEALERGSVSVEGSEGSTPPREEEGKEAVQASLPPPDFRIFEALGIQPILQGLKAEQ